MPMHEITLDKLMGPPRASVLSQIKRGEYAQEFLLSARRDDEQWRAPREKSNAADGEKDQHIHHVLFETVH